MPPPRSMKAPKSCTDATRPGSTAPGTIALRSSAALAFCSNSRCCAARDDQVLAAVLVLDDAEGVGLALVDRRILGADDVNLGQRAEGPLLGDADLVAALVRLLDLAFDGHPGAVRVLELALGGGVADALAGQHDAAAGRHDHRLDAVADRDLDVALVVLQLLEVDLGLALAADADEGHFRPEAGDDALDGLAALEPLGLDRRLEHRREIFFLLAHCLLLGTGIRQL